MKLIKQYVTCKLNLFLVALLALVPLAEGMQFIETNVYRLAEGETLTKELCVMASRIDFRGKAQNDLFLMAAEEYLSGEFNNDVWAMGTFIEFNGVIRDHARFMGQTILIEGTIMNNAVLVGNTVHLAGSSEIKGDVLLIGEDLIAEGRIQGDACFIGQKVTLSGEFAGDVRLVAQDIVVRPGTQIKGTLKYLSDSELVLDDKVEIQGALVREEVGGGVSALFVLACLLFGALIVGLVFVSIFPVFSGQVVGCIRQSFWKSFLTGFIAFCLVPLICFFAAISFIGIPLGVIIILAYLIAIYLAQIFVALVLATFVLRKSWRQSFWSSFLFLLLGLIVLYAGLSSGLIGIFIWFVMTFTGMGGLVLALASRRGLPQPFIPADTASPPSEQK